jgi:hypothetical protein
VHAILPHPDQNGGNAAWRPMLPHRDDSFAATVRCFSAIG